jgi:putative ABC transport system substrate-binding protein
MFPYQKSFVLIIWSLLLLGILQDSAAEGTDRPVVILSSGGIEPYQVAVQGVHAALSEVRVVIYLLDENPERVAQVMNRISVLAPRAIVAVGSQAVLAIKAYPISAPTVITMVVNHWEALKIPNSWVVSMHISPEKAYHSLSQVFPGRRIAIAYNPERTGVLIEELLSYFQNRSIELVPIIIRHPADIVPAIQQQRKDFDALWILPDSSFIDSLSIQGIMEYSMREGLPVIGYSEAFAKSGAVLSTAGHYEEMGRQAGDLARKIIRGDKPGRIELPRRISTFINVRVAKLMNIRLGDTLVALADKIYPTDPNFQNP